MSAIKNQIDTRLEKTANAVSASRLFTTRKISLTGDAAWDVSFDGEADVSNVLTLADTGVTAGGYGGSLEVPVLTVDSKGRLIAASAVPVSAASLTESGVVRLSSAVDSVVESQAATPKAVKAAYDLAVTAIPASEKGSVSGVATLDENGKLTASQIPATISADNAERLGGNLPAFYQDASNLTAGTLPSERLSDSGAISGDYTKVSIDVKGRVVLGKNLAAADIPALDASKINSGVFAAARIPTLNQNTTGNAATATKLATGRKINSVLFDGTTDIVIRRITGLQEVHMVLTSGTIDLTTANLFTYTVTGAITFTPTGAAPAGAASCITLELINGGSHVVSWWPGIRWADGKAPSLTVAGTDVLGFYTVDGGVSWTGVMLAKNIK